MNSCCLCLLVLCVAMLICANAKPAPDPKPAVPGDERWMMPGMGIGGIGTMGAMSGMFGNPFYNGFNYPTGTLTLVVINLPNSLPTITLVVD